MARWQGAKVKNLEALVEHAEQEHEAKLKELNNNDLLETPTKFREGSNNDHKKAGMPAARQALDAKKANMQKIRSCKSS